MAKHAITMDEILDAKKRWLSQPDDDDAVRPHLYLTRDELAVLHKEYAARLVVLLEAMGPRYDG